MAHVVGIPGASFYLRQYPLTFLPLLRRKARFPPLSRVWSTFSPETEEFCGRSSGSFLKLRLVVEPIEEGTGNLAYLLLIGRQPIYQPKLVKRKSMTSAFSNIPLSRPDNPDPSPIGLFLQVRQRNQRNQATSSDKTM